MADKNNERDSEYTSSGGYAPGSYDEYLANESGSNPALGGDISNGGGKAAPELSGTQQTEQTSQILQQREGMESGVGGAPPADEMESGAAEQATGQAADAAEKATVMSKLNTGAFVTSMLARIGGPIGKLAKYLNMSIRLLTILTVLFGGSFLTILGITLFGGSDNIGRYVSLDECLEQVHPYDVAYTKNENLSTSNDPSAAVSTIYKYLSDPDFIEGVIENGDCMENDPNDGTNHVSLSDAYTKWLPHNLGIGGTGAFSDEAIMGMAANAYAESGVQAGIWECYTACYKEINGVEQPLDELSGGTSKAGQNLAMTQSHHRDWSSYVLEMQKYWKTAADVDINLAAYRYHTMRDYSQQAEKIAEGYTNNPAAQAEYGSAAEWWQDSDDAYKTVSGLIQYYPGTGLWQWTGARAYALAMWADTLENVKDYDLDGHNDAMYDLTHQIYFVVYENAGGFNSGTNILKWDGSSSHHIPGSFSGPLISWARLDRVDYNEDYYINIPNKPQTGKTEWLGDRERYQIRHGVTDDINESVQVPALDYIYDDRNVNTLTDNSHKIDIDETVLNTVWAYFLHLAYADPDPLAYNNYHDPSYDYYTTLGSSLEDNWKKVEILMSNHTGQHWEGLLGWVDDSFDYWLGLTDYDMLDVAPEGGLPTYTSGGIVYSCGTNMYANLVSRAYERYGTSGDGAMSAHACYVANLSIFQARMYYDISSEVTAYQDGTTTILKDADGMNGDNGARPDNALFGGAAGSAIIYESSFENMTGNRGTTGNILSGDTDLVNHTWSASMSEAQRTKMMRMDGQWHDYEAAYGSEDFPGWTKGVYDDWWSMHTERIETTNYEWDTFPYRRALAKNRITDKYAVVPAVADGGVGIGDGADADAELAVERLRPMRVWSQARAKAQVSRLCAREYLCFWEGMGPDNLDFLNSHSRFDMLVDWCEKLIADEWEANETSTKNLLDVWHEHMSTAQLEEWQRSFYRKYCMGGGSMGFGGIAEMAVAMSWPYNHEEWATVTYDYWWMGNYAWGCVACTELYCGIKDIVGNASIGPSGDGSTSKEDWRTPNTAVLYSSCDRGTATSVRSSGADDNFPFGACPQQLTYARNSDLWEELGPAYLVPIEAMEPGDLIISDHHIITYVGGEFVAKKWPDMFTEEEAKYSICHSSISQSDKNSSRGLRCDVSNSPNQYWRDPGQEFYIFRLVGEPDPESVWVAALEAEKSYLATLKNGTESGTGADWMDD